VNVDVLAVGAHPDDVELGVGGLVHKLSQCGYRVAMLDLTHGEMSTRGTVEERVVEAAQAARILGVLARDNAGLPDGAVANTAEQQRQVIPFLRRYRPRILLAPHVPDRHPDHAAAHALLRDANYLSGLARIETGLPAYRTPQAFFYHPYYESWDAPPVIVDISAHFEAKVASLRAHASQFYNPDYEGAATKISSKEFWDSIETRAAYWGSRAGFRYGEPLFTLEPVGVKLPPGLGPAAEEDAP